MSVPCYIFEFWRKAGFAVLRREFLQGLIAAVAISAINPIKEAERLIALPEPLDIALGDGVTYLTTKGYVDGPASIFDINITGFNGNWRLFRPESVQKGNLLESQGYAYKGAFQDYRDTYRWYAAPGSELVVLPDQRIQLEMTLFPVDGFNPAESFQGIIYRKMRGSEMKSHM